MRKSNICGTSLTAVEIFSCLWTRIMGGKQHYHVARKLISWNGVINHKELIMIRTLFVLPTLAPFLRIVWPASVKFSINLWRQNSLLHHGVYWKCIFCIICIVLSTWDKHRRSRMKIITSCTLGLDAYFFFNKIPQS